MTTTPPPRLVPDRPSDAAIAHAFREFDDCGKHSAEQCAFLAEMFDRAREIDAAAPPAEAPGEVWSALVDLANQMDDQAARWSLESGDYAQGRTNTFCEAAYELREYAKRYTAPRVTGGRELRGVLSDLLDHVDDETCTHEETHRGGAIWTICDNCGQKWADDEGGFVPHEDAPAVAKARAALQSATGEVG